MLRVLSLGAGVQSTTLALMAARGALEPMPDAAIFADTQAEPEAVYTHLEWLRSGVLPFHVHVVTAGSLTEHVASERPTGKYLKVDIPVFAKAPDGSVGIINRSCTRDYKIRPITKKARELVGVEVMRGWRSNHRNDLRALANYERHMRIVRAQRKMKGPDWIVRCVDKWGAIYEPISFPQDAWDRVQADALVEQWIGISIDEADRMKPSRDPWIRTRWPLIERRMSRKRCLDWLNRNGYKTPGKSSCVFCPFHGADEWRALTAGEMQTAIDVDRRLRSRPPADYRAKGVLYLHRSCKPLDEIDFGVAEAKDPHWQDDLFANECEGMCGV